jgi:hypothetical protein
MCFNSHAVSQLLQIQCSLTQHVLVLDGGVSILYSHDGRVTHQYQSCTRAVTDAAAVMSPMIIFRVQAKKFLVQPSTTKWGFCFHFVWRKYLPFWKKLISTISPESAQGCDRAGEECCHCQLRLGACRRRRWRHLRQGADLAEHLGRRCAPAVPAAPGAASLLLTFALSLS